MKMSVEPLYDLKVHSSFIFFHEDIDNEVMHSLSQFYSIRKSWTRFHRGLFSNIIGCKESFEHLMIPPVAPIFCLSKMTVHVEQMYFLINIELRAMPSLILFPFWYLVHFISQFYSANRLKKMYSNVQAIPKLNFRKIYIFKRFQCKMNAIFTIR